MIDSDKFSLTKAICMGLPHGMKFATVDEEGPIDGEILTLITKSSYSRDEIILERALTENNWFKPILRSFKDLKNEITHNGETFVPWNNTFIPTFERERLECWVTDNKSYLGESIAFVVIEQFIEWGFDIYGLIPKGYAVDAKTFKTDPYA